MSYSFADHPDHEAQLPAWSQKWIDNAFSTAPADRDRMRAAIDGLHAAVPQPAPLKIEFVQSPITAAIAATIAAGAWWLRDNPDRHTATVGRRVSDAEVMAAIPQACAIAVANGMATLAGRPWASPIRAATYAGTSAATIAATDAATRAATDDATHAATRAATYAATDAATRAATDAATRAATDAATHAATYAATSAATHAATDAATYAATDAATRAATDAATRAATYAATHAATYAATSAATYDATSAATRAATYDATGAATRAATRAATYAGTDAATDDATVRFLLECVPRWWRMHNGGSDWSAWPSYLSFYRHIAQLDLPIYVKWQHYEDAALYGASRMMHSKFTIVSDRQTANHRDTQGRLHCDDGPARTWGDGWAIWSWHGVRVPQTLIEGRWSVEDILREPNAEIRRCAIERMGWPEFVAAAGLAQVGASYPDPGNPGHEIALYELPEQIYDEPVRLMLCTNGSDEPDGVRRRFGLTVPSNVDSPLVAGAWLADDDDHPVKMTPELYATLAYRS